MTNYELHVLNWKDCTRCEYSRTRRKVVLGKGVIPADILFVGEAPGGSEDVNGVPFCGQSGQHLQTIIKQAVPDGVTYAIDNITGCLPRDENGEKGQPSAKCIMACQGRLQRFAEMVNPKLIVCVGQYPEKWLMGKNKFRIKLHRDDIPMVAIIHPAGIMRTQYVSRGLVAKQAIVALRKAVEEHVLKIPTISEGGDLPF